MFLAIFPPILHSYKVFKLSETLEKWKQLASVEEGVILVSFRRK